MNFRIYYTQIRHLNLDIKVPDDKLVDGLPPQEILEEAIKHKWSRYRSYAECQDASDEYRIENVVTDPAGHKDLSGPGW